MGPTVMLTPKAFVAALKAEGCHVAAWDGWTRVDRPGPWSPVGVIVHHTGPPTDVPTMRSILRHGRPGLPGPLCHVGDRPDGTLDLVGWHDTNHAGLGDPAVLAAVERDRVPPRPRFGHDQADGNAKFYGIELIHSGSSRDPFPPAQLDSCVRFVAAVCRAHSWTANRAIFHKGWTTRKVDPSSSFPAIGAFRDLVAERLRHHPSWSAGDTQLDDLLRDGDDRTVIIVRGPEGAQYHLTGGALIHLSASVARELAKLPADQRIVIRADDATWKRYKSALKVVR
jgi:hypothetical protein